MVPVSDRSLAARAIALVAVVFLFAGTAMADEAEAGTRPLVDAREKWVNTGVYVALGGLTAFESFQRDGGQAFDPSLGFQIRGGYRIGAYLAAQASADFLSGWDTVADLSAAGGPSDARLTVDGGNVTIDALAYLPLGRFQPYALFGLGGMWSQLRSTDAVSTVCTPGAVYWYCNDVYAAYGGAGGFVMKFGGGIDFYATEDWALTVDFAYVFPTGGVEALRYYNLGWGVRFNF